MSDQPSNNAPNIPAMGAKAPEARKPRSDMTRAELQKELGTAGDLDERAAGLDMRAQELDDREAALKEKGIDPNPAPISPAQTRPEREHKDDNPKAIRRQMSQGKRLDARLYEEQHPDKKLIWINDMSGDVQRWIDAGAEPVPVTTRSERTFEGITDKTESKWVRAVGGDDGMGGHFWVYLLMLTPERYDEVELAPLRDRQDAIKRAMARGKDQSEGAGGELESYAPNLPTGGRGFEQIQDHMVGRG